MAKEVHSFKAFADHAVYLMEETLTDGSKVYNIEIQENDGCSEWTVTLHPEDFDQAWALYKKIEEVI